MAESPVLIVLAGGASSRMWPLREKSLLRFGTEPLLISQLRRYQTLGFSEAVVVGNPEIADAVVQDSRTIVLTGKGYGVTNLVVMDSEGDALVDEQVAVSASDTNSLRVYRRADINVFSCTPYCEPEHKAASTQ